MATGVGRAKGTRVHEDARKHPCASLLGSVPPRAAAGWVWVSLFLVFYTGLKLYAGTGDARGNLWRQMVGKREKKGSRCLTGCLITREILVSGAKTPCDADAEGFLLE
uniref:Uncharacterized protein n=1 Tax=Strix occidentalis caurina TaxID=311401 RepID=A0A8D0EUC2_STROC